jgi:HAD superfamily hydrolase (TIGR01509 family)
VRAVLFDLDHTLWYSPIPPDFDHITRLQAASIAAVLPRAGTEAFVSSYWSEWQRRDASRDAGDLTEPDWSEVMAVASRSQDLALSGAEARLVWVAVNGVPRSAINTEPCPGAIEMLRTLKSRGWRTAIVTNYPLESGLLRPHLEACGLGPYIDVVVTSVDTGLRKPHPRPFLDALEALKSSPAESVMVGDSFASDIAPAVALGMMAVHLSAQPAPDRLESATRIRELAQLPALLGLPNSA